MQSSTDIRSSDWEIRIHRTQRWKYSGTTRSSLPLQESEAGGEDTAAACRAHQQHVNITLINTNTFLSISSAACLCAQAVISVRLQSKPQTKSVVIFHDIHFSSTSSTTAGQTGSGIAALFVPAHSTVLQPNHKVYHYYLHQAAAKTNENRFHQHFKLFLLCWHIMFPAFLWLDRTVQCAHCEMLSNIFHF